MKKENKEKHLKILAVGDLHGDSSKASKLAKIALKEKVDLVVLAGDLTFGEERIDYLIGPFVKNKLRVLFVPGNHESLATAEFLENLYKPYAKNLHGDGISFEEIGFFGAGSAPIGPFFLSEKEIYKALCKGFERIKKSKKKIMVTHSHPAGTTMEKLGVSFVKGSDAVRKAIEKFKPDIAIVSHVHEASGIEEKIGKTKVINVGKEGKIIII